MVCKPGSYLEFTLPMFLDRDGYTFVVTGQLMHLETSTSLKFRNFIDCETLEVVGLVLLGGCACLVCFLGFLANLLLESKLPPSTPPFT